MNAEKLKNKLDKNHYDMLESKLDNRCYILNRYSQNITDIGYPDFIEILDNGDIVLSTQYKNNDNINSHYFEHISLKNNLIDFYHQNCIDVKQVNDKTYICRSKTINDEQMDSPDNGITEMWQIYNTDLKNRIECNYARKDDRTGKILCMFFLNAYDGKANDVLIGGADPNSLKIDNLYSIKGDCFINIPSEEDYKNRKNINFFNLESYLFSSSFYDASNEFSKYKIRLKFAIKEEELRYLGNEKKGRENYDILIENASKKFIKK